MKIFLIKNTILSYLAAHVALLLSPLFKLPLFPLLTSQTRCFSGHVTIFRASYSTTFPFPNRKSLKPFNSFGHSLIRYGLFNNNNSLRYFHISTKNLYENPLSIKDGAYSYVKDIKLNNKIKWVGGAAHSESIGIIGWFGEDKDLSSYGDFTNNVKKLAQIFETFSPLNSYSLAIIISKGDNTVKTADFHYLVNNTTNVHDLMKNIYLRISELMVRYKFKVSDKLICKYKPLSFKVKDPKFPGGRIKNTLYKPTEINLDLPNRFLSSSFLPHTMDIKFYGVLLSKEGNIFYYMYNDKHIIKLEIMEWKLYHKIQILDSITFKVITNIEDLAYGDGFIRNFNSNDANNYLFYDHKFNLLNIEFEPKIVYLTKSPKEDKHNINIITFDIETYKDSTGNFIPYACGFYDGKNKFLYYLTEFKSHDDMISQCLQDMIKPKYHNYTVYAHNLGNFDISFILKILINKYKVTNLLPRNNSLISFNVTCNIKNKKIKIKFADSICLLPASLAELGNSFNVETVKGVFPYNFVKENNLNYIGALPDIKYFDQPDNFIFHYQLMIKWCQNNWSLKDETLNYLSKDLISLYQILKKMDEIIFSNYRINITSHVTISSLAIRILRSNFLNSSNILPKSKGELEQAIRSSYYGGRCEVFRPFGYYLRAYDFNSLYPYAMLQDMPIGQPTFSLIKDLSKIFGFVKVKVTTPDNLYIPILPCRVENEGSYKLIFPLGCWTGWYFSEEVKLAVKYGYKIEVLESYIFDRGKGIFEDYVKHMSSIKDSSAGAMREIHKLLMNTPYGRMGMRNDRDIIKLVSKEEFQMLELKYNITYFFEIDYNKVIVKYGKFVDKIKCEQSETDYEAEMLKTLDSDIVNNSPAIASAIASWSRILMYPRIKYSYYTDTDSIFIDYDLNPSLIGKKIGLLKQEYGGLIKKGIFPSPKLYILDTIKGLKSKSKGISGGILTLLDYIDLYKGGFIEVKDIRWKRYLGIDTISLTQINYTISGDYDKRKKLYSKGRWINTSPLIVNSLLQIVNTELIKYVKINLAMTVNNYLPKQTLDIVLFENKNLSMIIITPNTIIVTREVVENLEKLTKQYIQTSFMCAANQSVMCIYRITGIMYDSYGDIYFYESQGLFPKRIYFFENGEWTFSNVRLEKGFISIK